jgi:hypothetical protein
MTFEERMRVLKQEIGEVSTSPSFMPEKPKRDWEPVKQAAKEAGKTFWDLGVAIGLSTLALGSALYRTLKS